MTSVFGDTGITSGQVAARLSPGRIAAGFYPLLGNSVTSQAIPAVDLVYLHPFFIERTMTFTALNVRVNTGGAASEIKMAVWRTSALGRPSGVPLLGNNTGVATTGTGVSQQAIASVVVPAGAYWIGGKATGTLPTVTAHSLASTVVAALVGSTVAATIMPGASAQVTGLSAPDAYANDIMALDLTSATFTAVAGGVPSFGGGFA